MKECRSHKISHLAFWHDYKARSTRLFQLIRHYYFRFCIFLLSGNPCRNSNCLAFVLDTRGGDVFCQLGDANSHLEADPDGVIYIKREHFSAVCFIFQQLTVFFLPHGHKRPKRLYISRPVNLVYCKYIGETICQVRIA